MCGTLGKILSSDRFRKKIRFKGQKDDVQLPR
jgi:hypothetical protein